MRHCVLEEVRDEVINVKQGVITTLIVTKSGKEYESDYTVLATGNMDNIVY